MSYFILRYVTHYLWLGLFASIVASLIGMFILALPGFPLMLTLFVQVFFVGCVMEAPLNLVILPVVFHLTRFSSRRRTVLLLAGGIGGLLSPGIAIFIWGALDPRGAFGDFFIFDASRLVVERWPSLLGFSISGAVAGLICAGLFNKHGDRPTVFAQIRNGAPLRLPTPRTSAFRALMIIRAISGIVFAWKR